MKRLRQFESRNLLSRISWAQVEHTDRRTFYIKDHTISHSGVNCVSRANINLQQREEKEGQIKTSLLDRLLKPKAPLHPHHRDRRERDALPRVNSKEPQLKWRMAQVHQIVYQLQSLLP
jgi:hypothetical protein